MTRSRKFLFSLITVAFVFAVIEGAGQVIWWRLEASRLQVQENAGQEVLRNDAIAFMKVPHGVYGYAMKPNFHNEQYWISDQGFHQKDLVPVDRIPGRGRIVCLGESTTFGNSVDSNYPRLLQQILAKQGKGIWREAEMINAGVPGWVSDQVALRVEHQLKQFQPDVALLYVGWNDFQSYNPLYDSPPAISYFEQAYKGKAWKQYTVSWLKSVALLSAWYHSRVAGETVEAAAPSGSASAESSDDYYRFLDASLDRIVAQFRSENPDTRVFVSTLAGRWPVGTPEEWAKIPNIWWMQEHHLTPEQSAGYAARLNDHVRRFAKQRNLALVDVAAVFERLDRSKLMWDWAHMTTDGYELVAWAMADALHQARVVELTDESRYRQLTMQYAVR